MKDCKGCQQNQKSMAPCDVPRINYAACPFPLHTSRCCSVNASISRHEPSAIRSHTQKSDSLQAEGCSRCSPHSAFAVCPQSARFLSSVRTSPHSAVDASEREPVCRLHQKDVIRPRREQRLPVSRKIEVSYWVGVRPVLLPDKEKRRTRAIFPAHHSIST